MPREAQMTKSLRDYMRSREVYRNEALAILVDAFRLVRDYVGFFQGSGYQGCKPSEIKPLRVLFFLSHFHSDHYSGITKDWCHGTIYASRATANLVCWRLGVHESYVKCMDLSMTYVFSSTNGDLLYETAETTAGNEDSFSVSLVPANHCPGAVMFLFRSSAFGTVLHTGDFRFNTGNSINPQILRSRWDSDLANNPVLNAVAGQVDVLFLDNTFCDPRFDFPPLEDILQTVNTTILSMFCDKISMLEQQPDDELAPHVCEARVRTVCLAVLVGAYFIGKERIVFSIQDAFLPHGAKDTETTPFIPTYVSPEKLKALQHLGFHSERFVSVPPSLNGIARGRENILSGFSTHQVRLPHDIFTPQDTVARNLFSSSPSNVLDTLSDKIRCCLTIFLVPLSSLVYPALAAACGDGRRKRQRSDSTPSENFGDDHRNVVSLDEEVLPVWENNAVDLKEFDGVLCVEPIGWTKKVSKQHINKRVTLLRVPYSEHSSFSELVHFVGFVNPSCIVPTVSLELFKKHEVLFAEKAPRLLQQYTNVQPLSRFLQLNTVPKKEFLPEEAAKGAQTNGTIMQKQKNPFAKKIKTANKYEDVVFVDDNDSDSEEKGASPPLAIFSNEVSIGEHGEIPVVAKRNQPFHATLTNTLKRDVKSDKLDGTGNVSRSVVVGDRSTRTKLSVVPVDASNAAERRICIEEDGGGDADCFVMGARPFFIDVSDSSD